MDESGEAISPDTDIAKKRYPALLWVTVGSTLLGAFQFGYHLGVLNTSLAAVAKDVGFTQEAGGALVVSACLLGAIGGALTAGQAADWLGPGRALSLNNSFFVLGSLLCATTPFGYPMLLFGRFLTGIGAGAASLYVPRYVAEVAPVSIRGGLTTLNQVLVCVGILTAYILGLPYDRHPSFSLHLLGLDVAWWRIMFAAAVLPAALQMGGLALSPESPVWLAFVGEREGALRNERLLLGERWELEGEVPQVEVVSHYQPLLQPPPADRGVESGWAQLLEPRYVRIMRLAAGLPLWQQASGINTVILYSSEVFKSAGLSSPVVGSIAVGIVNLGGSAAAVPLMDRAGRQPLLSLSHAGMAICLLALCLVTALPVPKGVEGSISFAAVLVFILSYGIGSGPIPWVYLPEILPDNIKGPAGALGTALNWSGNLLIGLTFPTMLKYLGLAGSYAIFTLLNVGAFVFVRTYVVETKQRTLHQITEELLDD